MSNGTLYIISAPSGAGKTTILKSILAEIEGLTFSVSHTTRNPRVGERDSEDYYFTDADHFTAMRDKGAFLEWAEVHGNFYGTSFEEVENQLRQGVDVILDIDTQGARQVRNTKKKHTSVFIIPPSLETLKERLSNRGTENKETLELRLQNARIEMKDVNLYDYVVVNDHLEDAITMLRSIIFTQRCSMHRGLDGNPLTLPEIS